MRKVLTIAMILFAFTTFGQTVSEVMGRHTMSLEEWNNEAKTNIRLLPKYGYIAKTEEQKTADKEFMQLALKEYPSNRKASEHLIELGFKYLYKDIKTAMYRFNQAFLLDSTNTDIYWGYGGVYMTLGNLESAEKQYLEGLSINSKNTHLLTDYGTYFMAQYYALQPLEEKKALHNLDSAINYLSKSYQLAKTDPNTTFKLSVCYFLKEDCIDAWKYYKECMSVGGQPLTEEYSKALKDKCKNK